MYPSVLTAALVGCLEKLFAAVYDADEKLLLMPPANAPHIPEVPAATLLSLNSRLGFRVLVYPAELLLLPFSVVLTRE